MFYFMRKPRPYRLFSFKKEKQLLIQNSYTGFESGIYLITCKKNNKIYIGSSINVSARWAIHILELKNKRHHNFKLQQDFTEFGQANFSFEKIWSCENKISRDELYLIEQIYINKYAPEYNIQKKVYVPPKNKNNSLSRHTKMKKLNLTS